MKSCVVKCVGVGRMAGQTDDDIHSFSHGYDAPPQNSHFTSRCYCYCSTATALSKLLLLLQLLLSTTFTIYREQDIASSMADNSDDNTDDDIVLLSDPSQRDVTAKASSILQKSVKLYGPMNALDYANETTCWNSEGSPQGKTSSWIRVDFASTAIVPTKIGIQFQAGFVAEEVTVMVLKANSDNDAKEEWITVGDTFEVDDDHEMQFLDLLEDNNEKMPTSTMGIKLVLNECTDFYGRVTIYQLKVFGKEVST